MGGYATATDTNESSEITGSGTANTIAMFTGTNSIGDSKITQNAAGTNITFAPGAAATGAINCFTFTSPANTNQTAGAEVNGWVYSATTRNWLAGAITTQREFRLGAPTYSFASASTITNAFTFFAARPLAGSNATITNSWAIGTQGGVYINGQATSSGAQGLVLIEQAANTNQTLQTEISGFKFTGSSRQWATGAITTQRETYFSTTTYTAVGASVISEAYGMYIEAPTASTNITITNNFGLGLLVGSATMKFGNLTGTTTNGAIYFNQTTPSASNYGIQGTSTFTGINGTSQVTLFVNNSTRVDVLSTTTTFTQGAVSGTATTPYTWTVPANTSQTASTEIPSEKYNGGSRQWATGAITTQRERYQTTTTYTAVGASTITNAYGMYIEAPTASTNITITNNFAFGTSGNAQFIVGSTTDGIKLAGLVGTLTSSAIYLNQSSPSAGNYAMWGTSASTSISGVTNLFLAVSGSTQTSYTLGTIAFTSSSVSSGAVTPYTYTVPANTGQTASTEISGFKFIGGSRQWNTGAITTQRETYFSTTTYSFVGASTITNAYGMYVERPTAGTNCTITTAAAIGTDGNIIINNNFSQSPALVINRTSNALSAAMVVQTASTSAWAVGLSSSTSSEDLCFTDSVANVQRMRMSIQQTSGAINNLQYQFGSNTGQTASTEISGVLYNSYTRTWATGAITTQREQYIKTVTYAFASASTVTNAYGMYIEAPTAGSNATITNNYALGLGGSLGLAAGTTAFAPLRFTSGTNTTTAVAGAMEYNGTNLFFTRTGTTRQTVLTANVVTTEVVVSDTTITVNVNGTDYKLLARA